MGVGVIIRFSLLLVLAASAACTKKNPDKCESNADCEAPLSFCDVAGEFEESGFEPKTCTVRPADCPLERCGCEPGAALTCDVDQLTVCNEDAASTSTTTCALGCSATEPRCLAFDPTNAFGPALDMASEQPDVVLPAGAQIDTDLGLVQDATGSPIVVSSLVVTQDGGSKIRIFMSRSFVSDRLRIVGSNAFGLAASGPITIRGRIDASADASTKGPGGQEPPASCVGTFSQFVSLGIGFAYGGGGGGNATMGGAGGGFDGAPTPGGATIAATVPLVGGCSGGLFKNADGTVAKFGGAGGGALQMVSRESIAFTNSGFIDVGGGGGGSSAGGGSGGTVVLEAPLVRFDGSSTGVAANGGAGGGCDMSGADANVTSAPAIAPKCTGFAAGNGGTADVMADAGELSCGNPCVLGGRKGGGGGAVGRLRVATRDGTFQRNGAPIISAIVEAVRLVAR